MAAIEAAVTFVGSASQEDYDANLLLRSGVERQPETLGEACARLDKGDGELLTRLPACRLAIGMRNRIIHGYDAVDDETVYRTLLDDLPALRVELAAYLASVLGRQPQLTTTCSPYGDEFGAPCQQRDASFPRGCSNSRCRHANWRPGYFGQA